MPRDSYDPFKDESLGQKPKRKPPAKIDWKAAAWQLAEGKSPAAVADSLGIGRDRLWRHLHKSKRFQHWLQQEVERQRLTAELQLGATARAAAVGRSLLSQAETAEGLQRLVAVADAAGDAKTLVGKLADTGLRPEAAERRSKKAEGEARQAEMSRQLQARIAENRRREAAERALEDEARALLTARLAAKRAALDPQPAGANGTEAAGEFRPASADADESQRTPMNGSESQRTPANTDDAAVDSSESRQTPADAAEAPADSSVAPSCSGREGQIIVDPDGSEWFIPAPDPDEPTPPPSLASIYRSITDLNGPFAQRPAGTPVLQNTPRNT